MKITTFSNFTRLVPILKSLDIDTNSFAVTGGGSLSAHGIRDCADLDCVLHPDAVVVFDNDSRFARYENEDFIKYSYEDIDFFSFKKVSEFSNEEQIVTADIVENIRYVNLVILKYFKQLGGREKDLADVILIEESLASL
jgi:hypothetical protein